MAVREILVHLDSPEVVGALVPAAAELARDLRAPALTLAALAEVPLRMSAAPLPFGMLQARENALLDLLDRMETRARDAAPGVQIEWRGAVSPVAQTLLARWGVRADLIILSHRGEGIAAMAPVDVGAAILAAGRPVLVAPRASPSLRFERVLIGFKSTREARAALAAAVPLLERTRRVLIASVGAAPANDLRDAATFLHGHGVRAETAVIDDVADGDAAGALLALAEEEQPDLLVTGAWGHGRAREMIFGGVTRTLLADGRLACLMVH